MTIVPRYLAIFTIFQVITFVFGLCFFTNNVNAQSLQISPLLYKEKLKPGEVKKGFVDVSNPSSSPVNVKVEVLGFKQIDSNGNLTFFESEQLKSGIKTDFDTFPLGPRQAVRMYFIADGRKLPLGDIFAALFVTNGEKGKTGIIPASRVGTLLILENGTSGSRQASIESIQTPVIAIGNGVNGTARIKNTADPNSASGFFPTLTSRIDPFGHQTVQTGKLIYAGISRDVQFSIPTNRFGLHKLTLGVEGDESTKWVFMITGWCRWALISFIIMLVVLVLSYRWRRGHSKR